MWSLGRSVLFCGAPPRGVIEAPLDLAVRGAELGCRAGPVGGGVGITDVVVGCGVEGSAAELDLAGSLVPVPPCGLRSRPSWIYGAV